MDYTDPFFVNYNTDTKSDDIITSTINATGIIYEHKNIPQTHSPIHPALLLQPPESLNEEEKEKQKLAAFELTEQGKLAAYFHEITMAEAQAKLDLAEAKILAAAKLMKKAIRLGLKAKDERVEYEKRLEQLEIYEKQVIAQSNTFDLRLAEKDQEIVALGNEIAQRDTWIQSYKIDNANHTTPFPHQDAIIEQYKSSIKEKDDAIQLYKVGFKNKNAAIDKYKADIQSMQADIESRDTTIQLHLEKIERLETDNAELTAQLDQLDGLRSAINSSKNPTKDIQDLLDKSTPQQVLTLISQNSNSPSLSGITRLELKNLNISNTSHPTLLQALARMTSLTYLDLSDNQLGDDGINIISSSLMSSSTKLTTLILSNNQIGDNGIQAITYALKHLPKLNLDSNNVTETGVQSTVPGLLPLTVLHLCKNKITDIGARAIASSLPNLKRLRLSHNHISDIGVQSLSSSLKQLVMLDLSQNRITHVGVQTIASSLTNLKTLALHSNQLGDIGAQAITSYNLLPHLTMLVLSNNNITDIGAQAIAASLSSLVTLHLDSNIITDLGTHALVSSLKHLTTLTLRNNQISDKYKCFAH